MAAGMDLVPVLVFEEPAKVPRRTSKKLLQGLRRYQDSFPQANSFLLWLLCLLVISSAPFNAFDEAMLGLGHGAATLCVMAVVFACGPRLGLGDFRHFLTVLALLLWPRSEQRWCRAMLKAGQSPAEVLAPRAALGFVLLDDLLRVVLRYFEGEPAEAWPFAVTSRGLYQLWSQDEEWWEACYRGAAWHRLPVRLAPPSINRLMKEAMLLASMMAETFGMMVLLQNSSTATSWAAAPCIASTLLVVSCSPWLPRQSDLVLVEMSRLLSLVSKFAVYVQTLLLLLSLVAQPQSPLRCIHQDGEGLTGAFFYLETASLVALCTLVTYQLLAVVARCRAASPLYAVPAEEVVTEHASHRSKPLYLGATLGSFAPTQLCAWEDLRNAVGARQRFVLRRCGEMLVSREAHLLSHLEALHVRIEEVEKRRNGGSSAQGPQRLALPGLLATGLWTSLLCVFAVSIGPSSDGENSLLLQALLCVLLLARLACSWYQVYLRNMRGFRTAEHSEEFEVRDLRHRTCSLHRQLAETQNMILQLEDRIQNVNVAIPRRQRSERLGLGPELVSVSVILLGWVGCSCTLVFLWPRCFETFHL